MLVMVQKCHEQIYSTLGKVIQELDETFAYHVALNSLGGTGSNCRGSLAMGGGGGSP